MFGGLSGSVMTCDWQIRTLFAKNEVFKKWLIVIYDAMKNRNCWLSVNTLLRYFSETWPLTFRDINSGFKIACIFYTHRCTEQPVTLTSPFASTETGRPTCGVAEPCCSCEGNKGKRKKTGGVGKRFREKKRILNAALCPPQLPPVSLGQNQSHYGHLSSSTVQFDCVYSKCVFSGSKPPYTIHMHKQISW